MIEQISYIPRVPSSPTESLPKEAESLDGRASAAGDSSSDAVAAFQPSPLPMVPPPPEAPAALLLWAETHNVLDRLDDVFMGAGGVMAPTYYFGHAREPISYRMALLDSGGARGQRRYFDDRTIAREFLHRIARLVAAHREVSAWLAEHGREPDDEVLAEFLARLREDWGRLVAARETPPRAAGTYQSLRVEALADPLPRFCYIERPLTEWSEAPSASTAGHETSLHLLGWNEGPWRWTRSRGSIEDRGEVGVEHRLCALSAMIDFARDPRQAAGHLTLIELLRMPAWQYALGDLDARLSTLQRAGTASSPGNGSLAARAPVASPDARLAFRVHPLSVGTWDITPMCQRRGKGGTFSKGSRLHWHQVPGLDYLTPTDRRVFQAYDDPFARAGLHGGLMTPRQLHGTLRALIDHPAVFLEGEREQSGRLDIRQGRLNLRFANAPDGGLTPQFDLMGLTLLPAEMARALQSDGIVIHLHRPEEAAPQMLLAQVTPEASALISALALAPGRFPPEAHDALAGRLESLQESLDIEFPSQWTRTLAPADGRMVVRLELLASGAIQVRMAVRPVKFGPVFAPGEGPALVLEGQGSGRHAAKRDRAAERVRGHALSDLLDVGNAEETEPWSWRVSEGDPALHVVGTLKEQGDEVVVEWADDVGLFSLGSVGRGEMRMRVADRRDWFGVEGGAEVKTDSGRETVPLADLLAAIRDGRRYVAVGARGFVRIEETLREALARAESALFDHRGSTQIAAVGSDALLGLVERESQVVASAAFTALRRRMKESVAASPKLSKTLKGILRPYQKEGIEWLARLAHWGAGAILADEMGLGKTLQTLAILEHRSKLGPALVVAPTSVVSNWISEAQRFSPKLNVRLYHGNARAKELVDLGPGDCLVTSFAVATLDAEALTAIRFASLVIDEAQAVKNATTERAKALRDLNADWRLALTGTPIENHLGEVWSILRVISPGVLGSWEQFRARYAMPIEKFNDDTRRKSLATLLRPFVLRRTKSEVARDLPARTEIVRSVRLSKEEQALYEELRLSTLQEIAAAKQDSERDAQDMRFVLLAALTRLRQLCCHPRLVYPNTGAGSAKAAYLLELLDDLREGGHKALVFSQFRSFLELLAPRLRQHGFRVLVLDGTTPADVRTQRIDAFQRGEADAFLISLKAGGFGLNLTAADYVIHLDPWWNPAVEDQATARAHRIGQTRPVTAVRLVARGTIEESVLTLHAAKRALAAGVLEGTEIAASLKTDELIDLIRRGDGH